MAERSLINLIVGFLRQELAEDFLMSECIIPSLLDCCILDDTQLSDSLHLVHDFLMAFFCNLVVNHFSFCSCILDSTELFLLPGVLHVQVPSIQIILGNLLVIVEDCELIMLLRLEILLES